jgi:hypothetical protein
MAFLIFKAFPGLPPEFGLLSGGLDGEYSGSMAASPLGRGCDGRASTGPAGPVGWNGTYLVPLTLAMTSSATFLGASS